MFTNEEIKKIEEFVKNCSQRWAWSDIITTMGPTKLQNFLSEIFSGEIHHHWSPTTPEGYVEIKDPTKNIVVHWLIGEKDEIVNLSCLEDVDFDEIDKSLSSTIIQNSVIRLLSEDF